MLVDHEMKITLEMEPRADGGLRLWSEDFPGLILSFKDQRTVLLGVGSAIVALLEHKSKRT